MWPAFTIIFRIINMVVIRGNVMIGRNLIGGIMCMAADCNLGKDQCEYSHKQGRFFDYARPEYIHKVKTLSKSGPALQDG